MKYLDVYVDISPSRGDDFEVSAKSAAGGEGNSALKLPFKVSDLSGVMFDISSANRGMSVGIEPTARIETATTFGVQLFEALFQGETREVLSRTESEARRQPESTGVRIRLTMNLAAEGMAEVASLPWELMRRRDQAPFVVSVHTPVVRAFDTPKPVFLQPIEGKLRILALVSNPTGTAALNLSEEKERIGTIWNSLDNVEVDFVRPVEEDILFSLAQHEYHVIHYMGHGDFDSGSGGLLMLEHADGSGQLVTGDTFAAWLQDEPLRLVFLNACNTGTTGQQTGLHPFAGVASALIRNGIPSVVAMQFPITDEAAITFAQTFYQRIAQGLPVDAAVSSGRLRLLTSKGSEWATPVLYMRAADGELFGQTKEAAKSRRRKPAAGIAAEPAGPPVESLAATSGETAGDTAAPQAFMASLPPPKPWYLKAPVLGGIGAVVLIVGAIAMSGRGSPDSAAIAVGGEAAQPLNVVPDPNNPATKAIAAIDAARWINDSDDSVPKDVLAGASIEQVRALAEAGYDKAQYVLGAAQFWGLGGTPASRATGAVWLDKAAGQGLALAEHFSGVNYANGVPGEKDSQGIEIPGLAKDESKARVLLRRAIAHGNDGAWNDLKNTFLEIVVVPDTTPPDPDNPATAALAVIDKNRWTDDRAEGNPPRTILDSVKREMVPIAANQTDLSLAMSSITALAINGNAYASYLQGQFIRPVSMAEAAKYFEVAAKAGIPAAMYQMGQITNDGAPADGDNPAVKADPELAKSWYTKAAELGNQAARSTLKAMQ